MKHVCYGGGTPEMKGPVRRLSLLSYLVTRSFWCLRQTGSVGIATVGVGRTRLWYKCRVWGRLDRGGNSSPPRSLDNLDV